MISQVFAQDTQVKKKDLTLLTENQTILEAFIWMALSRPKKTLQI